MSLDEARAFIASAPWTFAKTMPENPHEWTRGDGPGFEALLSLIRSGEKRRFRGRPYHTVVIDGWSYWMTWAAGPILNRKKSAEAGWDE